MISQRKFMILCLAMFCWAGALMAQDIKDMPDTSGNAPLKPQDLIPIPETDTRPIKIKIGKVTYAIPRNYIYDPVNGLPIVLRVTWPGFQPFTEATRPCMDHKIWRTCLPIELRVGLGSLNSKLMANAIEGGLEHLSSDHPYGYDLYEMGPADARSETYRREQDDIFVECYVDKAGTDHSICDDYIDADPANFISVRIFILRNQLADVPEINRQAIALMNSFKLSEDKP